MDSLVVDTARQLAPAVTTVLTTLHHSYAATLKEQHAPGLMLGWDSPTTTLKQLSSCSAGIAPQQPSSNWAAQLEPQLKQQLLSWAHARLGIAPQHTNLQTEQYLAGTKTVCFLANAHIQ